MLVVASVVAIVLAHSLTSARDIFYTDRRRYISPLEQLVHSYLEVLPVVGAALLVLALGAGAAHPGGKGATFALQLKSREEQLPARVLGWIAVGMLLAGLAVIEEHWRTRRHCRTHADTAVRDPTTSASQRET